jgi:predicted membrane protein
MRLFIVIFALIIVIGIRFLPIRDSKKQLIFVGLGSLYMLFFGKSFLLVGNYTYFSFGIFFILGFLAMSFFAKKREEKVLNRALEKSESIVSVSDLSYELNEREEYIYKTLNMFKKEGKFDKEIR